MYDVHMNACIPEINQSGRERCEKLGLGVGWGSKLGKSVLDFFFELHLFTFNSVARPDTAAPELSP